MMNKSTENLKKPKERKNSKGVSFSQTNQFSDKLDVQDESSASLLTSLQNQHGKNLTNQNPTTSVTPGLLAWKHDRADDDT